MSDGIQISLTMPELMVAAQVAIMRQVQNIKAGRKDRYGASMENGWQIHVEGACGEKAVAKYLGLYWSGSLGNLDADDVGTIQVRTAAKHSHRLILHPTDPDDRPFVLVTGIAPSYFLRGWIYGHEGKLKEFWKDPQGGRPAYFVSRSLRPMQSLLAIVHNLRQQEQWGDNNGAYHRNESH